MVSQEGGGGSIHFKISCIELKMTEKSYFDELKWI